MAARAGRADSTTDATMRARYPLTVFLVLPALSCSGEDDIAEKDPARKTIDALEFANRRSLDEQVIKALADAGSDLSKPHSLEHHFVCDNLAEAKPIIAWGEANGFQPSEVSESEHEGRSYAYFDLIKPTVPAIDRVFADTKTLLQLAADHGIEYDGWGCSIVK